MRKGLSITMAALLTAGCGRVDRAADDFGNASDSIERAAGSIGNAADRLTANGDAVAGALLDRAGSLADRTADRLDDAGDRASDAVDRAAPGVSALLTDGWVGRWRGVEGLNLVIARDPAKGDGHYLLTDTWSLDDKGVFEGVADGRSIRFTRPDGEQVLRHTDGEDTGLKYLADKRDCLTVQPGEGYCRD